MSLALWTTVDRYITDALVPSDETLDAALAASAAAGLPPINVTPNQGKFLHLLARIAGATRILELGTLGGYSTIWLARALAAGGSLVTLESDPKHAEIARANVARAGLRSVVQLRLGPACESLDQLASEGAAAFDLVFIDADKPSYPDYLTAVLRLSHPGTVIVADNVVRGGKVADDSSTDASVQGVRLFNERLRAESRVTATTIQTVGSKGYDGFTIAVVI